MLYGRRPFDGNSETMILRNQHKMTELNEGKVLSMPQSPFVSKETIDLI
jgi:hypothetical protein